MSIVRIGSRRLAIKNATRICDSDACLDHMGCKAPMDLSLAILQRISGSLVTWKHLLIHFFIMLYFVQCLSMVFSVQQGVFTNTWSSIQIHQPSSSSSKHDSKHRITQYFEHGIVARQDVLIVHRIVDKRPNAMWASCR